VKPIGRGVTRFSVDGNSSASFDGASLIDFGKRRRKGA